jgi:transketolase
LGRENFPKNYATGATYELKKAQVLLDNTNGKAKSVAIATTGSLVLQALEAAKQLEQQGIGTIVLNCPNANHIDIETFKLALSKSHGNLVTVEDHQIIGGFSQMLCHVLLQAGLEFKLKALGVHGEFGQSSYTALELYKKHGIDSAAIVRASI